jgi:hypothetical protein
MSALPYSREALRRFREERKEPKRELSILEQVPPDAPADDAVLTVWNGERFIAWEKWLATAPIVIENRAAGPVIPVDAECVSADCGGTRVWLARDGDRWLMFAGSRKSRRKDFASPFLEHAIRTAEQWYGAARDGWQVEKRRNGKHNDEAEGRATGAVLSDVHRPESASSGSESG